MHKGLIAGLMLGSAAYLSGQNQPVDPSKRGTVSGLTVDGKSGEPVRKVLVILRLVPSSASTNTPAAPPLSGIGTTSDAAGRFTFQDLDPGTYAATTGRDGYVAARESLRQIVTVKAGETADKFKLKLLRTGVISGRVLDSDGEPVRNASVQIRSARQQRPNAQGGAGASTNDRGEYRAFGISPGEYKLSATYSPGNAQQFDVRMQAAKKGSELADATAYPTLYYPDTLNSQQAIAVSVEPGSELQGYDFHLRRQHAVTVGGRITGPVAASSLSVMFVELVPLGGAPGQAHQLLVRDPEGQFELPDVLPGTYRLSATRINMASNGESESHRLTANRTLHVEGVDVRGIQLAVGALLKLNGRFVLPEGRLLPPSLTVMLEPRDLDDTQSGGMAPVGTDGSLF